MVIQGEFFRLIPVSEHSNQFDLELLYKIGGKNPREEYKNAGYGLHLDTAIKKCIQFALSQKFDTISLKEYLHEYRKIEEEIGILIPGTRNRIPAK